MKSILKSTAVIVVIAAALITGCKGKEKIPAGEKVLVTPCSGPEYFTDDKVFRANSSGESSDMNIAKQKARLNAEADLARAISVTIKSVTDNYVNSTTLNNKEDAATRFEGLTRAVVEQDLKGVKTKCEVNVTTQQGTYKSYIAIEIGANELLAKYNERLSKDERLKIDYDYEKFKDTFDKEMEKRAKGN